MTAEASEIRDLWEAVNSMRGDNARILAAIEGLRVSIEARNGRMDERCETRLVAFVAYEDRLKTMKRENDDRFKGLENTVKLLSDNQIRLIAYTSIVSSVLAVLGSAGVSKLLSLLTTPGH